MAVKIVQIPLTVVHPQYQVMTNDRAAMNKNVERLGKDQETASAELNTLLNDGYTIVSSQPFQTGTGTFMAMVLYQRVASEIDAQQQARWSQAEVADQPASKPETSPQRKPRHGYVPVRIKDIESVPVELRGKIGTTNYEDGRESDCMMYVTFDDEPHAVNILWSKLELVAQPEASDVTD